MLKIPNKINPFPVGFAPPPLPWLVDAEETPAEGAVEEDQSTAAPMGEEEDEAAVNALVSDGVAEEQKGGGLSLPPPVSEIGNEDEILL